MNNAGKETIKIMKKNALSRHKIECGLMESIENELHSIKLDCQFVVVGGHAVSRYSDPRSTSDVDILVSYTDYEKLLNNNPDARNLQFNTEIYSGITIGNMDIITSVDEWVDLAVQSPNIINNIPYIDKKFLILMKMISGNSKDIADIISIIKSSTEDDVNTFKSILDKYDSKDIEDFESLVVIADLESGKYNISER